jgi:predicted choloylglycine hydrolase
MLFGRNFDLDHEPCVIVRVHSGDGISSVSVVDPYYLNLNAAELADLPLAKRLRLLFAPYLCQDGMNADGVAVSSMAVPERMAEAPGESDRKRPVVIKPVMMRLILESARNTDEAVELLQKYHVDCDGMPCHFMIADASGKSVVVEFAEGKLETVATKESWQVATNHVLTGRSETD